VSLLIPETKAPARPIAADGLDSRLLYLRSYLLMRAIIGFIGVTLPLVLVVGDHLIGRGVPFVRGSVSDYYYSGMRDFFTGSMFAAGIFLIAYKIFERSLNNLLTVIAGLAAFAVALFPTNRAVPGTPLTPLQDRLGEATVAQVHLASSGVFILSLAVISFFFGLQEGRRTQQRPTGRAMLSPHFWRWFHWTAALLILASVAFLGVTEFQHTYPAHSRFVAETVAVVAFGLSWLFKGLELDILFGSRRTARIAATQNP
jgi:hypothetical protein